MHETFPRTHCWPHTVREVYATVSQCASCAKSVSQNRQKLLLQLFLATCLLKFVATDILGLPPKTAQGNHCLLALTDRYSILVQAIPMSKKHSKNVTNLFIGHWIVLFEIPAHLDSDSAFRFASRFFQFTSRFLGIKCLMNKAYHPQTNGQSDKSNWTKVTCFRKYVPEHQKNRDLFFQPLKYACH